VATREYRQSRTRQYTQEKGRRQGQKRKGGRPNDQLRRLAGGESIPVKCVVGVEAGHSFLQGAAKVPESTNSKEGRGLGKGDESGSPIFCTEEDKARGSTYGPRGRRRSKRSNQRQGRLGGLILKAYRPTEKRNSTERSKMAPTNLKGGRFRTRWGQTW